MKQTGTSTNGTGGTPKAIRSKRNVHVVNGHLILSTSADGGTLSGGVRA